MKRFQLIFEYSLLTFPRGLKGRQLWLRPGESYTVGRKKNGKFSSLRDTLNHQLLSKLYIADVCINAEIKTISRVHVVITVAPVNAGDGTHPSLRSKVTIKNQKTLRTIINDEIIKNDAAVFVTKDKATMVLGKSNTPDATLTLRWHPVVISVSSTDELKQRYMQELEKMDIKVLTEMLPITTHYVKGETNSQKVLMAAIRSVTIVSSGFLDKLIESADLLKADFNKNFPDFKEYVPEPWMLPNPNRKKCLQGYTIVFDEPSLKDNLDAVIRSAGGKCLLFDMSEEDYQPDTAASAKKFASFVRRHDRYAIVVRHHVSDQANPDQRELDRLTKLYDGAKELGTYAIDAAELATAIQNADAKSLRRVRADESFNSPKPVASAMPSILAQSVVKQVKKEPVIRRRPHKQANLLNFLSEAPNHRPDSSSLPPAQESQQQQQSQSQIQSPHKQGILGKRRRIERVISNALIEEPIVIANAEQLAKRRKIIQEASQQTSEEFAQRLDYFNPNEIEQKKQAQDCGEFVIAEPTLEEMEQQQSLDNDVDMNEPATPVQESALSQRMKNYYYDEDDLDEDIGDLDLEKIRDLIIVDMMPARRATSVIENQPPPSLYEGRPNYKKFKRRGTAVTTISSTVNKINLVHQDGITGTQELVDTMFGASTKRKHGRQEEQETPRSPVQRRSKRQRTVSKKKKVDSDDENLFVGDPEIVIYDDDNDEDYVDESHEENEDEDQVEDVTSSHTLGSSMDSAVKTADADDDEDDDDEFKFRFRRR